MASNPSTILPLLLLAALVPPVAATNWNDIGLAAGISVGFGIIIFIIFLTYCCCQPEPSTRPRKSSEEQAQLLVQPRSTLLLSPGLFSSPDTKLSRENNDPTPAKDSVSVLINAGIYSGVSFRKSMTTHTRTTFPPFSPSSIVRNRSAVIPEAEASTPDAAHDAIAIVAAGIPPSTSTVAELDETDFFAAAPSPANVEQPFITIDVPSHIDPAVAAEVEAFISSGFPEDEQRLRKMSSSSITESIASDMEANGSFMMSPLHSAKRSMELDNYIAPPTTSIWTSPAVVLPTESAKHGISARKYSSEDGTFMFERNIAFKAPDFTEVEKPKEADAEPEASSGAGVPVEAVEEEAPVAQAAPHAAPPGPPTAPKSAKKKPAKKR